MVFVLSLAEGFRNKGLLVLGGNVLPVSDFLNSLFKVLAAVLNADSVRKRPEFLYVLRVVNVVADRPDVRVEAFENIVVGKVAGSLFGVGVIFCLGLSVRRPSGNVRRKLRGGYIEAQNGENLL